MSLTDLEKQSLCKAARETARNAHAIYSNFRVGAAVLCEEKIYIGVNVENASYGLSLCAERTALATAIAQGEKQFRAIAVACIDADKSQEIHSMVPCGACRQWISELASEAEIVICGQEKSFSLEELMPFSFSLNSSQIK